MTDTDKELEELRQQTDVGTRAQSTPSSDEADVLEDAIVALLDDVESGEVSKTLSMRDARLTALIRALEETGELDAVGDALRDDLGIASDDDGADRSEVLRLAVRVGLREAAPDVLETAREASARHAADRF
ncbi:hypothetical protein EFA46_015970 (plasmid) [Halarchaeum sp. CBA1220]|uniref:hypothetical protein n=1 Tax=Halarchaeum sp. CBA1220 TaxID=1853682 RepID=UPI000F3A8305|nr:hypothetical protein [Halarchaeum sp. CBA1220]QLC35754.1 hypothetical protein EFA46_015970 [Halarchaeum sp. CBA1220]